VAEPTDTELRWRKRCTHITSLAVLVGLSTILPWFARNTILPAGDGHLEILSAWTPGRAVAPAGDGWAGPLRVLPWGAFFAAVALAGAVGGVLAKRRPPGDRAARWPTLISVAAAGVGLLMVPLVWMGAATGVDTDTLPMFGLAIAVLALVAWLVLAIGVLRMHRRAAAAPAPPGRPARNKQR
jgi:hypothetical protein